jgi:hypothetical protein
MPRMGFEPTISVFERAKTVHALDRAATVIVKLENTTSGKCRCYFGFTFPQFSQIARNITQVDVLFELSSVRVTLTAKSALMLRDNINEYCERMHYRALLYDITKFWQCKFYVSGQRCWDIPLLFIQSQVRM